MDIEFIEKWAKFVIEHTDKEWSELQAVLIDSQIENARDIRLTKEQVKEIKDAEK